MITTFLHEFWNGLISSMSGLKPWLPILAAAIIFEWVRPVKRVHPLLVLVNLVYLPLALTLSAVLVLPIVARLERWLPVDFFGLASLKSRPAAAIGLWLAYLAAFDFLYYWFHRSQHTFRFLWRYHMVHHSDANVSASTAGRHHWMEDGLRFFFITAPLAVLLGGGVGMPLWVTSFVVVNSIFMHWNMRVRFGVLEHFLITPAYHRIHHSIEDIHFDKNFGVFTQLWDYLFGTRWVSNGKEFPDTGIKGLSEPKTLALLLPFPVVLESKKKAPDKTSGTTA